MRLIDIACGPVAAVLAVLGTAGAGLAQPALTWASVDGGGGRVSSGLVALNGTVAQADASCTLRGGTLTLSGGFWGGSVACLPVACSAADVTGIGGPPAVPDGLLTGDDFNAFIAAFAGAQPLADITGIGGPPAVPDGLVTGDDFNAFIAAFASGCP
jgi:hypothetical protein